MHALALCFLAGVLAFNGLPHLIRGVTRERYPSALGNGPVTNFLAGWLLLVLAWLAGRAAHFDGSPPAVVAAAVGGLLMGLFHAGPGAFGRREAPPAG